MNDNCFISRIFHVFPRRTLFGGVGRTYPTGLGLLAAAALMTAAAHARDLPDGWAVHRENKGATYAPVKMRSGEKLEIWVSDSLYDVPRGASAQNQLLRIRQQAGALEGDNCQPPEAASSGLVTQQCTAGDSALQYMLLPSRDGGNRVRLLRIRAAGRDETLARYKDGLQQTLLFVVQGQAQAQSAPRSSGDKPAAQTVQAVSQNHGQAVRTAPGQGVQDDDIAAIFVTEQVVKFRSETVKRAEHTTWLLLKDGTGYPIESPPDELNVKASRQLQPQRWVQWRRGGSGYEIRGPNDNAWRRLPADGCSMPLQDAREICLSATGWVAQPARAGARLNGTYEHLDGWGNMISGIRTKRTTWHFNGDGTFTSSFQGTSGYVDTINHFSVSSSTESNARGTRKTSGMSNTSGLWQSGGGGSVATHSDRRANDGASHQGRYRLKGWVLEVDRADGRTERHLVTFRGDSPGDIDIDSTQFEGKRP